MYKPRFAAPRPPATGIVRPGRAFDGYPARAFDAGVGAGSYAFVLAQLALIDPKIVEPLQAVTHPRDIPIKLGGGFPTDITAWSTNYATPGVNGLGIQGTSNTEIPEVQADVSQGSWKVLNWAHAMTIGYLDIQRLDTARRSGMPPPISLQELYEKGLQTIWNKALDYNTYFGFNGLPGLVNNPYVPEVSALTGSAGHTPWSTKTFVEILNDFNYALNIAISNSGYDIQRGMPTHCLIPWSQYALLTQPATLSGVGSGFNSILDYVEAKCIANVAKGSFKIDPLPNNWLSGQGAGSPATDRAVFYRNDDDNVKLYIPTAMRQGMTMPTARAGGAYETIFNGCFSQVAWLRTTTAVYLDAI